MVSASLPAGLHVRTIRHQSATQSPQEQNEDIELEQKPQKQQEEMIMLIIGAVIGFVAGVVAARLISNARDYFDDNDL